MPKNLQPQMGENIENLLIKKFDMNKSCEKESLDAQNCHNGIANLLAVINKSGCCNPEQAKLIQEKAIRVAEFYETLHGEKEPDFEECVADERHFMDIVTFINSCRLDCHDCLNGKCSNRDPECPVKKVQQRAKQFKKGKKFSYNPSY